MAVQNPNRTQRSMAVQNPNRTKRSLRSKFNGTTGKYFGVRLGCALLSIIPIIGVPNAMCILERYKCKNTEIVGMSFEFNGKSGELLKKMIGWFFLSLITIGIYGFVVAPMRYEEWRVAHTTFGPVIM
ncbi:MAG: DUF898 family protein [Clostridia bacterium]